MLSRREWIGRVVALAGLAGLTRADNAAAAGSKVSQAAAKYQDYPKDGQMCATCTYYIPPDGRAGSGMMGGGMGRGMMGRNMAPGMMAAGSCQVVEGSISPRGWCILYSATRG